MNTKLVAHIVSIWPMPLVARRTLFLPFDENEKNVWDVPAASPEEPQIICLHQYKQIEDTGSGKTTTIIDANDLAADLVNELAAHKITAKGRPGVFVADDVESKYDGAVTSEQVKRSKSFAAAVRAQQEFALSMVAEAREHFRRQKPNLITEAHFAMANLLGVRNEQWQERVNVEAVSQRCWACTSLIPTGALICLNRKEVLDPVALEERRSALRNMAGTAVDPMADVLDMANLEALTAPTPAAAS